VVSTHLKNISQIGLFPTGSGENKKYLKPPTRGSLVSLPSDHAMTSSAWPHTGYLEPSELTEPRFQSKDHEDLASKSFFLLLKNITLPENR